MPCWLYFAPHTLHTQWAIKILPFLLMKQKLDVPGSLDERQNSKKNPRVSWEQLNALSFWSKNYCLNFRWRLSWSPRFYIPLLHCVQHWRWMCEGYLPNIIFGIYLGFLSFSPEIQKFLLKPPSKYLKPWTRDFLRHQQWNDISVFTTEFYILNCLQKIILDLIWNFLCLLEDRAAVWNWIFTPNRLNYIRNYGCISYLHVKLTAVNDVVKCKVSILINWIISLTQFIIL